MKSTTTLISQSRTRPQPRINYFVALIAVAFHCSTAPRSVGATARLPDSLAASETFESGSICQLPQELALTSTRRAVQSHLNIDVPVSQRRALVAIPSAPSARPSLGSKATGASAAILKRPSAADDVVAKPFPPTHRVEGRIRFEYVQRSADIIASVDNANFPQYANKIESTQIAVARRSTIILEDDQGHYIPGKLNENGEFLFEWNPAVGPNARVTVWTVSEYGGRNAAVGRWVGDAITQTSQLTAETGDYRPFSYTYTFSVASALISNGGQHLNLTIPEDDDSAQAFWLLENTLVALDYFLAIDGVSQMPKINVVFTPEMPLDDGTAAYYSPWKDAGFVFMPHDYGWVDFAVRHEVAHAFQFHYTRINFSDGYYGRLAEPLANAHSAAMEGNPWMDKPRTGTFESFDAQANFVDGEFRLEDSGGNYWAYCAGCDKLDYSYGWTQRVLWDLLDGTQDEDSELLTVYFAQGSNIPFEPGEFDLIDGGLAVGSAPSDHLLNDVLINYLGGGVWGIQNPNYEDRGLLDLDVVDVLDGFICRGHATADEVDQLINHAMMFGYPAEGPTNCN